MTFVPLVSNAVFLEMSGPPLCNEDNDEGYSHLIVPCLDEGCGEGCGGGSVDWETRGNGHYWQSGQEADQYHPQSLIIKKRSMTWCI